MIKWVGGVKFEIISPSLYECIDYPLCIMYASERVIKKNYGWYVTHLDGARAHHRPFRNRDLAIIAMRQLVHEEEVG